MERNRRWPALIALVVLALLGGIPSLLGGNAAAQTTISEPYTLAGENRLVVLSSSENDPYHIVVSSTYQPGEAGEDSTAMIVEGPNATLIISGSAQVFPASWLTANALAIPRPGVDVTLEGRTWTPAVATRGMEVVTPEHTRDISGVFKGWTTREVVNCNTLGRRTIQGEQRVIEIQQSMGVCSIAMYSYQTGSSGEFTSVLKATTGGQTIALFNGTSELWGASAFGQGRLGPSCADIGWEGRDWRGVDNNPGAVFLGFVRDLTNDYASGCPNTDPGLPTPAPQPDRIGCTTYETRTVGMLVEPTDYSGECIQLQFGAGQRLYAAIHSYARGSNAGEVTDVLEITQSTEIKYNGTAQVWPAAWLQSNGRPLPFPEDIGQRNFSNGTTPSPGLILNTTRVENITDIYAVEWAEFNCSGRKSITGETRVVLIRASVGCVGGFYTYRPGASAESATALRFEQGVTAVAAFSGTAEFFNPPTARRYASCNDIAGSNPAQRNFQPLSAAIGLRAWAAPTTLMEDATGQYAGCAAGIEPAQPGAFLPLLMRP